MDGVRAGEVQRVVRDGENAEALARAEARDAVGPRGVLALVAPGAAIQAGLELVEAITRSLSSQLRASGFP